MQYSLSLTHTTFAAMEKSCTSASEQVLSEFKQACNARSYECHCRAQCDVKVLLTNYGGQPTLVKEGMCTTPEGRRAFEENYALSSMRSG